MDRTLQSAIKFADKHNVLPISHFYLLAKIHKTPLTTRPIVSVSGSLLFGLGKWVDFKLQELIRLFPTRFPYYISSSTHLVNKLHNLNLPQSVKLCSADAVSMYTNIETGHALSELKSFFQSFPNDSIHEGLLHGIEIIMRHCLFYFDNKVWAQLSGTAMGAPPAPMYATFYFAIKEATMIQKYSDSIIFYGRFIDDTILIVNQEKFTPSIYQQLQNDFNSFGKL